MFRSTPSLSNAASVQDHSSLWNLPGAQIAYEGGRRALRAGFYEPARSIFGALLPHEPDHPEVGLSLARTELAAGNPVYAELTLESLDAAVRRNPTVQVLLAECALQLGEISQGLSRSFACIEAFPQHSLGRFLAARLLWLGGQEDQAEFQFLSMAADPGVGARSCAWAVFCGWRKGQRDLVSDLLANLRTDDVVCEGLREFGHRALGIPWIASDRVESLARQVCADAWNDLFHRRHASISARPAFAGGRLLG